MDNLRTIKDLKKNDIAIVTGCKDEDVYLKLLVMSCFINTKFIVKKACSVTKIMIISFLGNDIALGAEEADKIFVK